MFRTVLAGAAALAFVVPGQVSAQANADVSLFSQGHYLGARTPLLGAVQFPQPKVVRSLTMPAGTQWELCSGNTFTGCRQFSQTTPAMVMTVRSARPVASVLPPSPALPAGEAIAGQSLRGVASEYFVAPDNGTRRIEVLPATAEAMSRAARDFCQSRGWRSSVHARLQTIAGSVFLADVLCTDPQK